jgi:hypothetical protein
MDTATTAITKPLHRLNRQRFTMVQKLYHPSCSPDINLPPTHTLIPTANH